MDKSNEEYAYSANGADGPVAAESTANTPVLLIVYRVLIIFALILVLFLVAGSLFAVFTKSKQTAGGDLPGTSTISEAAPHNIFTGIGRQRLSTADSFTVILSVTFPYPVEDRTFTEELVSRTGDFRSASADYFLGVKAQDLLDESAVKAALLERYNSLLRLGKIEILYFVDFFILE